MLMIPQEVWILAPIVMVAYTTQSLTGFGASLIAVTLGAHFMPIDRLVPLLIPLTVAATGYIAWRERQHIERRLLFTQVFPFMGLGVIAGLILYELLKGVTPRWLLGLIVVSFASRQLWLEGKRLAGSKLMHPALAALFLVMAGIAQAFYTTGGPFITYAIMSRQLSKAAFRATLCAVWSSFNVVLIVVFIVNGRLDKGALSTIGPLFLLLPLAFLVGDRLHDRVDERSFRLLTCILLILSGLPLVIS